MNGKRIIVLSATGMVGGCALRLCLEHTDVSHGTSLGRHTTGMEHTKLGDVVHTDFLDYTAIGKKLVGHELALYCLGVYTGAVPEDEFKKITVDYTLAFAEALKKSSPQAAFCFLSGQGADPAEKSKVAFARYKGMAENGLLSIGFQRVHIFRPGYIYPVTPRKEPNLMYTLFRPAYPVLRIIYPNIGISSEDLAHAMVQVRLDNQVIGNNPILENKDIREVAAKC
jgi:hypothetical protein